MPLSLGSSTTTSVGFSRRLSRSSVSLRSRKEEAEEVEEEGPAGFLEPAWHEGPPRLRLDEPDGEAPLLGWADAISLEQDGGGGNGWGKEQGAWGGKQGKHVSETERPSTELILSRVSKVQKKGVW